MGTHKIKENERQSIFNDNLSDDLITSHLQDLCNYMYCTNGIVTKPAHPALEGSICGQQRVCFAGRCRPEQDLIKHIILFGVNPTHVGGGKDAVKTSGSYSYIFVINIYDKSSLAITDYGL